MKRILFLSKSRLSQNLMELIIPCIPKKIGLTGFNDPASLTTAYFPKPYQLVMLDENFLGDASDDALKEQFASFGLRHAKKILVCNKNSRADREKYTKLGVTHFHTKPFLAEELAAIVGKYLGHKK